MTELKLADFYSEYEKLPSGSAQLIILDIPWGIFGPNSNHPDIQWDHRPALKRLGDIASRLLDNIGYIVLFGDRKLVAETESQWSDLFTLRDELVWAKPGNIPTNTLKPLPVHEFIHIYMHKGTKLNQGVWNPRVLPGKPYVRKTKVGVSATRRQIKSEVNKNESGLRHIRSVLEAPNKPAMKAWEREGIQHPTMKPVKLLSQLIRVYSNPADLILDPFAGSGSTALASFLTGRKSISYENDSTWFYQSVMRFNRVKEMLGAGQIRALLEQSKMGIDEFDMSVLYF
jgi:hypothetical protein